MLTATRETRNLLNPDQRDALLLIFNNRETCEGPPCYTPLAYHAAAILDLKQGWTGINNVRAFSFSAYP